MELLPLRLNPGDDLRDALVRLVIERDEGSAFVVSGIGSLGDARLRFAGEAAETTVAGPLEIISLSGSITPDGAHLHLAVADRHGHVTGGHAGFGNIVRTTVEAVLVFLPGWHLTRELDPATAYAELMIKSRASRT